MSLPDDDPDDVSAESLPVKGLTRHALKGIFWLFSSSSAQSVLNVLITALLARLLTPADFGLVAAAMVIVGLTEIFQMAGIGPGLVQRQNLNESHVRTGFTISLLFGCAMIGLIWLLAPLIAHFFNMPDLARVLRVMAFVFPLHAVSVISRNLMQRALLFKRMAGLDVIAYLIGYGGAGVMLAWNGWGVWALVAAHLAYALVQAVLLYLVQPHSLVLQCDRQAMKDLVYSAGGFTAAHMLTYSAGKMDSLVTGRWLGSDALGGYNRALAIAQVMVRVPMEVLNRVLFPSFAKVQQDRTRLARAVERAVGVTTLLILPVSVGAFILADEIVAILLGKQWGATVWPLRILSWSMLFNMLGRMSSIIARSCGDVYRLSIRQGLYAVSMFLGAWAGQFYGLKGVAVGVTLAFGARALMGVHQCVILRVLTWRGWFSLTIGALSPAFFVAVCAGGVAWMCRFWGLHPLATLFLVGGVAAISFVAYLLFGPTRFVGRNVAWCLRYVNEYWPTAFIGKRLRGDATKLSEED
jgi:PST family polysaccharide transporter